MRQQDDSTCAVCGGTGCAGPPGCVEFDELCGVCGQQHPNPVQEGVCAWALYKCLPHLGRNPA